MKISAVNSLCRIHAALLLSCCLATIAPAADRVPVTSIKPLLIAAIERGEARGTLIGEAAAFMRERFKTSAPIEIDVRAIGQLREAGCRQLEVSTRQDAVRESKGEAPAPKELVFQVSYCRDGRFPDVNQRSQ